MIQPPKITCDVCGIEKRECNHWFTVLQMRVLTANISLLPCSYSKLVITEFRPLLQPDKTQHHACGEICLVKLVTRWTAELLSTSSSASTQSTPSAEHARLEGGGFNDYTR